MTAFTQHIAAAIAAVTFVGTAAVWATDRDPPVTINEVKVLTPIVQQDGDFIISYDLERQQVCQTEAQRTIFDGANVEIDYLPDRREAFGPVTKHDVKSVKVHVPLSATPGTARYRVVAVYRCNPLHQIWPIVRVLVDQYFTIIEKPKEE